MLNKICNKKCQIPFKIAKIKFKQLAKVKFTKKCWSANCQSWALALFYQVRSPLIAQLFSVDRYRSIAHFLDFQVRSSLNRSQKDQEFALLKFTRIFSLRYNSTFFPSFSRLPSLVCRLPSAVSRLPSPVCRLLSAVSRLPSAVCRLFSLNHSLIWSALFSLNRSRANRSKREFASSLIALRSFS
jgi:hypothetical protein